MSGDGRFLAMVADAMLGVSVIDALIPDEDIEAALTEWSG